MGIGGYRWVFQAYTYYSRPPRDHLCLLQPLLSSFLFIVEEWGIIDFFISFKQGIHLHGQNNLNDILHGQDINILFQRLEESILSGIIPMVVTINLSFPSGGTVFYSFIYLYTAHAGRIFPYLLL